MDRLDNHIRRRREKELCTHVRNELVHSLDNEQLKTKSDKVRGDGIEPCDNVDTKLPSLLDFFTWTPPYLARVAPIRLRKT